MTSVRVERNVFSTAGLLPSTKNGLASGPPPTTTPPTSCDSSFSTPTNRGSGIPITRYASGPGVIANVRATGSKAIDAGTTPIGARTTVFNFTSGSSRSSALPRPPAGICNEIRMK